jgi:hypothetical protein
MPLSEMPISSAIINIILGFLIFVSEQENNPIDTTNNTVIFSLVVIFIVPPVYLNLNLLFNRTLMIFYFNYRQ